MLSVLFVGVVTATRLRKIFGIKSEVAFNNESMNLKTTSLVGSWNQKILFENIDEIELQELSEDTFRVVVHYQPQLPFNKNIGFLSFSSLPLSKQKEARKLVVVDALWGHGSKKISELYQALTEKHQQSLAAV